MQQEDVLCALPEVGDAASTGSIRLKAVHLVQDFEVRKQNGRYWDFFFFLFSYMIVSCILFVLLNTKEKMYSQAKDTQNRFL